FVRKWIPELQNVPDNYIHEPWQMTEMEMLMLNFDLKRDYYAPIVNVEQAAGEARKQTADAISISCKSAFVTVIKRLPSFSTGLSVSSPHC
ncbi:MAG: hypothetical protein EBZ18_05200, partial [Alphaproteobacteria bacterium]|nr:hypothetical protein [Alphaproteobacteria bacterium]